MRTHTGTQTHNLFFLSSVFILCVIYICSMMQFSMEAKDFVYQRASIYQINMLYP